MFTTYAELQSVIAKWLIKAGLEEQSGEFIFLAETSLKLDFRVRNTAVIDVAIDGADNGIVTLPADFKEVAGWTLDGASARPLIPFKASTVPTGALGTGVPDGFVVTRNHNGMSEARIYPKPAPTVDYESTLIYRQTITPLSITNPTNWLLTNYPAIYLYAALEQSAPYLKDDQRLPIWIALKEDNLNKLWQFEQGTEEIAVPNTLKLELSRNRGQGNAPGGGGMPQSGMGQSG